MALEKLVVSKEASRVVKITRPSKEPDKLLGYRLKPNLNCHSEVVIVDNDTIFNVCYSSDMYGRRISETPNAAITKSKHALFLGCSYTFGAGLKYTSTIPYLFEERTGLKSYNYGVGGYGPHQSCLLFDEGVNTINNTTIKESSGMAIYTYINYHLYRVYGGSKYLSYGYNTPDVFIENDRPFIRQRSRSKILLARALNSSSIMKHLNFTTSYPKNDTFYRRFADIINYTAKKYWDLKPNSTFYIGIYPEQIRDLGWVKYLNEKIITIEVPLPEDYLSNDDYLLHRTKDRHPSELLNKFYVNYILNKTNINSNGNN